VHRFLLNSPCPVVLVVSEVDARDEHCVDQYVPASIRKRYNSTTHMFFSCCCDGWVVISDPFLSGLFLDHLSS
jgi:iron only hydrogenase large subunit-like protein